jgi:hypothetical protein
MTSSAPTLLAHDIGGAGNDGVEGQITQVFLPERRCAKLLETAYLAHGRRLAADPNTSERPRRALSAIFHGPRTPRGRPLVHPRPWRGQPD